MENSEYSEPLYRFNRALNALGEISDKSLEGSTWLDLGCNLGQLMCVICERYGVKATGLDDWNVEKSQETFLGTISDKSLWRYYQRDLSKTFDLDEKFDVISALEVLEHMTDTDLFLENCWNSLKEGGYFLLTTPNINSLRNRVLVPFGIYPAGMEYRNIIHHVRLYNVATLRKHLSEHNFDVELVRGVCFLKQKHMEHPVLRFFSNKIANLLPQLSGNLIVVCRKQRLLVD